MRLNEFLPLAFYDARGAPRLAANHPTPINRRQENHQENNRLENRRAYIASLEQRYPYSAGLGVACERCSGTSVVYNYVVGSLGKYAALEHDTQERVKYACLECFTEWFAE